MFLHLSCLIVSAQLISARVGMLTCVNDDDCTNGYSCHESMCTKCLKCDLLLRKGKDCVVDFNECGECLKGYEEVLITDSSTAIKPCKPVRLKEKLKGRKCENDETCPPNNYCHEESCVKCFNCSLVNRLSAPGNCTKLLSNCGSCVNGFEEVAVTLGTDLKLCKRSTAITAVAKVSGKKKWGRDAYIFISLMAACGCVILAIATIYNFTKKHKAHVVIQSQCPQLPSAPPLSVMGSPQHIKKMEEEKLNVVRTTDYKQQAKVFKQPDALYYFQDCHAENETNSHHDSEELNHSIMADFLIPLSAQLISDSINPEVILDGINAVQNDDTISETESPEEPSEVSMGSVSVDEEDRQTTGISLEDKVDTGTSDVEKNHSD